MSVPSTEPRPPLSSTPPMIAAAKLASSTVDPAVGSAAVRSSVLMTPASAATKPEIMKPVKMRRRTGIPASIAA